MKHILLLGALSVATMATAQTGAVKSYTKISSTSGNLIGPLANSGRWGYVSADGTNHIRVGAPFSGGGSMHFIELTAQGTVYYEQLIHSAQLPLFQNTSGARFGMSSVSLGDVNNDGKTDYLAGAPGLTSYGALVVLLSSGMTFTADTIAIPAYLRAQGSEWGSHLYRLGNEFFAGIEAGTGKVVSFGISPQMQMLVNQVYDNNTPIIGPMLQAGDRFGTGVSCADMDGDGITDILCGAPGDDDGGTDFGAVYIIMRNADKSVKSVKKISTGNSNFTGYLNTDDEFGISIVPLGDLDQDGYPDFAVGAPGDDDALIDSGAIWVIFMNPEGNVKLNRKISRLQGNFNSDIVLDDRFGTRIASVGDLDGDGVIDLVSGTPGKDDGGTNRGAMYCLMLELCPPHSAVFEHNATGTTVQFSAPGGPGITYLWNFDDGGYSQVQNPVHTYNSNGTYNVCLQVVGPCGSNFYCAVIIVTGSGGTVDTRNALEQEVKVFPNPAKEYVQIETPGMLSSIRIIDLTGKVSAVYNPETHQTRIDLSGLPRGLYFLEMNMQGGKILKKLQVI